MADLPRLNNIIRALEGGQHALTCFAPAHVNSAIAMSASKYDGCVFEMEHNPWDGSRLRDCLAIHAQPRADRQGGPVARVGGAATVTVTRPRPGARLAARRRRRR